VNVTVGASVGVYAPEAALLPRGGERRVGVDRREDDAAPVVQDVEALLRAGGQCHVPGQAPRRRGAHRVVSRASC
jgi:hypothetical protein